MVTNITNTDEQTRSKKWVILHFTEDLFPLMSGENCDGDIPPSLVVVFHRDPVSEAFKNNNPSFFTRSYEDLNFLFFENGKLLSSTSSSEWDSQQRLQKVLSTCPAMVYHVSSATRATSPGRHGSLPRLQSLDLSPLFIKDDFGAGCHGRLGRVPLDILSRIPGGEKEEVASLRTLRHPSSSHRFRWSLKGFL